VLPWPIAWKRPFETGFYFCALIRTLDTGDKDLTGENVKFFAVYSYLIVYRPGTKPLEVVAIIHGRRKVEQILEVR
jgi:plasmid stabilization system protein ParE